MPLRPAKHPRISPSARLLANPVGIIRQSALCRLCRKRHKRHSYLTLGGRAGIDLRTLQELAGHSTSKLTERYTHVRLHDMAGAVDRLPSVLPTDPERRETQVLRATGTDGPSHCKRTASEGEGSSEDEDESELASS